jgi:hypothetical protein
MPNWPKQGTLATMTILITGPIGALRPLKVNRAWEAIRENIRILAEESLNYYELKKHKP